MNKNKALENIEQWVDWLLLHSSFSIPRKAHKSSDGIKRPRFKWFNGAFLIEGTDWLTGEDYGFYQDATRKALAHPLQVALANTTPLESGVHGVMPVDEAFQVLHVREAKPEEWRGKPWSSERYLLSVYFFYPKRGTWDAATLHIGNQGKNYVNVSRHGQTNVFTADIKEVPEKRDDITMQLRMSMGVQFTSEYFWHADIGWPEHPKLRLPMTSDRALKLFSLREIPTDNQRRTSLLHWIMGHQRVLNKGEESEKIVRVLPHLRGEYDFGWNGLNVKVYPSESLLRDTAKAQKVAPSVTLHKERVEEVAEA